MPQPPIFWMERKFHFQVEENILPAIRERLLGTIPRLEFKLRDTSLSYLHQTKHVEENLRRTFPSTEVQKRRIDGKWSIREQVGHLIDLEELWQGRIEDLRQGETVLRAWDLVNRQTFEAGHNERPLKDLLDHFTTIRRQTLAQIEEVDEALLFRTALHPRLQQPMHLQDLLLFVAEHDDHHLAMISYLLATADQAGG